MNQVNVTNVTFDELLSGIKSIIPEQPVQRTAADNTQPIMVLNKTSAARALDISDERFNKLMERGLIPYTVHAGFTKTGRPVWRWAEHHLRLIKPEIQKLKRVQNDDVYSQAKARIYKMLGL